jgi:hypothetical protein
MVIRGGTGQNTTKRRETMKMKIQGAEVEGTPDELADFLWMTGRTRDGGPAKDRASDNITLEPVAKQAQKQTPKIYGIHNALIHRLTQVEAAMQTPAKRTRGDGYWKKKLGCGLTKALGEAVGDCTDYGLVPTITERFMRGNKIQKRKGMMKRLKTRVAFMVMDNQRGKKVGA